MAVELESVEFCLLGPLEARRNGEPVPLGGAKQRALLARLLVDAPSVVSTDRLIDDLWGERSPEKALHTVQVFVSRLRKALGPEALLTRAPGYFIAGEVDVARFRALTVRARASREAGEAEQALACLREGLSLWRGPPLAEFAYESFAAQHIERLEEERLAALEERLELELELGHHARLVGELEELCAAQPLRERLHEFLMLALYRSSRQSEALQVYGELRRRLVEELGLDPGASIQALERRILQQDATLEAAARRHRRLPEGTVTLLFTDIEGSTQLLHELGPEGYARALAEHRRVLRQAFAAHHGVEVDTQGDALFVAFPTALGALAAATEAQAELNEGPVRVRMALHTGTPLLTDEGYVGADVHRAARIAAAGHGGQVLVSASTAALADGVLLRDLGEHRFKDLTAPERVYQLGNGDFEPLKTLYQTNLPVPATAFLGRDDDLAVLVAELQRADVRLLTLTGPGGTGKTRLALQAAAEVAEDFPDGMTWVPLAPIGDPTLVLATVAQSLGLEQDGKRPLEDLLATSLGGQRRLLLLDNAEHLLPPIAADVARLRDIAGPKLLVTSRERLQVQGEHVYAVPSLTRPDAVALFTARAAALGVAVPHSRTLEVLCEHLDDLPLALELAAARTPLFTPEQLLERLGQKLDLLKGGRDADPRQQTLRATIQWSHDLLDEAERTLFRRLSVFAGGCDYDAVEAVCDGEAEPLQSLLDKSLLRRRNSESGPRYWMLETIRDFATERLGETTEGDDVKRRHGSHYAEYAAAHALGLRRYDAAAEAFVSNEQANLRAGLADALSRGDAASGALYLYGLWFHWLRAGLGPEGAAAARAWIELEPPADQSAHFAGLIGAGEILRATGDAETAIILKEAALATARANEDRCVSDWPIGRWIPALLTDLAHLLLHVGRPADARPLADEALAIRREVGNPSGVAHALQAVVQIEESEGHIDRAYELACEALARYEAGSENEKETFGLRVVSAEYEAVLGRPKSAAATLASLLEVARRSVDVADTALMLRVGATLALSFDRADRAAKLFAAFERLSEDSGVVVRSRSEIERDANAIALAEATLGREAFGRAARAGRAMETEAALDELATWLAELENETRPAAPTSSSAD